MGCDIHMCVEIKNKDGIWETADLFRHNKYYDNTNVIIKNGEMIEIKEPLDDPEFIIQPLYDNRNYTTFSILAGVRNGCGITPIEEPRGFPSDACDFTKREYDEWGPDAHTPSYLTLQELIDWNSSHTLVAYAGMVSPEDSDKLDNGGLPNEWCSYTSDDKWVYRTWESEHAIPVIIEKLKTRADEFYFIYGFLWDSDKIESRKEAYDKSKDMRIVFWFDN